MLEQITKVMYKVALYIRLSKEDVDRGYDESESIKNQRTLLVEYVEKLGPKYQMVEIYIDQGYTGTNFNRPDFQRMIKDINLGKINMVVTKDLSRLGRDYIETGEYVEKWFPENNVRYVSVTDGIDTFEASNGNNDIAPFKSILNDMYSKDLSKKIKTALHTMQKHGKWVGGRTAMGYLKDPNDKNHLVICEDEAEIIRKIFEMAKQGYELYEIKNYLINNRIPTVSQMRYGKLTFWECKAIKNILRNEVYIGTTIQNKRSRISYKNRKLRPNPVELWNIVEDTHDAIIDKETFYAVQKMKLCQSYKRNEKKNNFLLDGLLICYECKHRIGIRVRTNGTFDMVCNYYRRNSKLHLCTSHGFKYKNLENNVLNYIKNLFEKINNQEIELDIKAGNSKSDYKKMMKKIEMEIKIVNENIDKMYLDKLNGKLSEEMYNRLFEKMTSQAKEKEQEYRKLQELQTDCAVDKTEEIKKLVKEFLELKEPTPEIMRVIINRIELHQDKQVDIYFNFRKLNEISRI